MSGPVDNVIILVITAIDVREYNGFGVRSESLLQLGESGRGEMVEVDVDGDRDTAVVSDYLSHGRDVDTGHQDFGAGRIVM